MSIVLIIVLIAFCVQVNLGGTVRTQVSASVNIAVPCEQSRPMVFDHRSHFSRAVLGNWRSYCKRTVLRRVEPVVSFTRDRGRPGPPPVRPRPVRRMWPS